MSFYLETTDMDLGDTPIENIFLNDYMPMANGTYVKVYLLGFKYAHDKDIKIEVTNETISRHLNIPMDDVLRAWDFWEDKGIIEKIEDREDSINYKVKFLNLKQLYIKNNIDLFKDDSKFSPREDIEERQIKEGKPTKPSVKDLIEANKNPSINKMFNNIDYIIRRQTVPQEKQRILSWISDYNMSPDVIEEAFNYSFEKRSIKNLSYVETLIRNWYDEGLTSLEEVLEKNKEHNDKNHRYYQVLKALGLHRRPVRDSEREVMDMWFDKKQYPLDLVLEACNRDKTSSPSVNYVNGILESWEKKGIGQVEDIDKLDKKEESQLNTSPKTYSNDSRPKAKKTRFHNFKQRSDNYTEDELEAIAKRKREEHLKRIKGEV